MMENSVSVTQISFQNWAQYDNITEKFPVAEKGRDAPILFYIGENGAGKTRFFQGLRVALFGANDPSIVNRRHLIQFIPIRITNEIRSKLDIGEDYLDEVSIRLSVTLKVVESGVMNYFKIERVWTFDKFSFEGDVLSGRLLHDGDRNPVVMTRTNQLENWDDYEGPPIETKLRKWFPEESREFYFFDGEKLEDMMSGKDPLKKSEIIGKILGRTDCTALDNIILSLKKQEEQFETYTLQIQKRKDKVQDALTEVNKKRQNLRDHEKYIAAQEEILENTKGDLYKVMDEIDKLNMSITDATRKRSDQEIIKKYHDLTTKKVEIHSKLGTLFMANNNFEWIFIENIVEEVRKDMQEKMEQDIIPSKLDKSVYDIALNKKECTICGTKLVDSGRISEVNKRKDKSVDTQLNKEARRFLQRLDEVHDSVSDTKIKIQKLTEEFFKIEQRLDSLGEIPEGSDSELLRDYFRLARRKEDLLDKINKTEFVINDAKAKNQSLNEGIVKAEEEYEKKLKSEGKISEAHLHLKITSETLKTFKKIREELEENIINYIKKQAEENFLQLIPDPDLYEGIFIGDDWTFGFYLKEAPLYPVKSITGPSKGQFHILGISFLHSIAQVADMKLPIIFDTPFGRISDEPKERIGKNLRPLFQGTQVIMFVTDAEARNMVDFIIDKKCFKITNENRIQAKVEPLSVEELKALIA